jgi:hypothetical protein
LPSRHIFRYVTFLFRRIAAGGVIDCDVALRRLGSGLQPEIVS